MVVREVRPGGDAGEIGGDTLAMIEALRRRAWSPHIGEDRAAERFAIDRHDRRSWHLLVEFDGEVVGAGRLTPCRTVDALPEDESFGPYRGEMTFPIGLGGRLAVHPAHQQRGHAAAIIEARLALAKRLQLRQVWSETRATNAAGFLRRGYTLRGPSADASVPGDWQIFSADI